MAAANPAPGHLPTSNNVCFAELIVRLDSLLTLRPVDEQAENEAGNEEEKVELENDINLKLTELHLRLKNGGSIHDGSRVEEDEEDEAVSAEDSQGPPVPADQSGSVDCVGCSSAEDENEVCPSPIVAKAKQKKTSLRSQRLMNHDNTTALLRLCVLIFTKESSSNETLALAAQLIAEMCREHEGRKMALQYKSQDVTLIQSLGKMLRVPRSTETCVQTCRIIGNLCYECDQGRQQVIAQAQHILAPLVKAFENSRTEDPGQRLPVIFPGCLLNLCNETPEAVEAVARYNCADSVLTNILQTRTNDAVFNSSILFLEAMANSEMGVEHLSRCSKLPPALIHVLDNTTSPEVCSTLLELLRICAEAPALVLHLAKGGLMEYLVTHMNGKLNSEAFRGQLRVTSCDILVILLANDEAMQVAFEKDTVLYIDTFLDWLKNGEDNPLKITAALCMGNLCSSKDNCNQLLGQFAPALIQALVEHSAPLVRDVKLQHAIMGALRNLAVAPEGRGLLLQKGILLPCLDLMAGLSLTPITHPVVMKLLGTTRLLVDSEKEVSLAIAEERLDVLAQIIAYGNHENAGPGPKAESGRLIAGILKNCHSLKAMKNVMNLGGLPAVTVMLHSNHARMLNEALVSLTILSSTLAASSEASDHDLLHQHLHTDLTINAVKRSLTNTDLADGLKANAATFLKSLLQVHTQEFQQMLAQMNFCQECGLDQPDKLSAMPKEVQDLAAVLM